MNLILLDFLENLTVDMTQLIQSSFNGQILSEVKELKQQIHTLQDSFSVRLIEHNKAFIETLKDKLSLSSTETHEKLSQQLNRNTDLYMDQLKALLPKSQEDTSHKLQDHLSQIQKNIQTDIQHFLSAKTDTLPEFLSTFETKLSNIQGPIFSMIHANQENLSNKIGSVKDDLLFTKNTTEKVYSELNQHLNKYSISSQFKGMCAEIDLHHILCEAFPTYHVENTTGKQGCGDFMIQKDDEPFVMIEMKNYKTNVDREEITKFLKDVSNVKTHAIMISNYSGIVGKPDFHVEIDDSCILVYLHHLQFSADKIKMAVNLIENLHPKLKVMDRQDHEEGISVKKEVLANINSELSLFLESKAKVCQLMKEQHKIAITQIEHMAFPDLSLFLQDKFVLKPKKFACDCCSNSYDTKAQLSSHKKVHKSLQNISPKDISPKI
jgi:hypothetical protein